MKLLIAFACIPIDSFRIALRQIKANDENITDILKKFEENGFINYYGTQRFGNHASVPTHQIGLFLLQGDFKTVKMKYIQFPVRSFFRLHFNVKSLE